MINTVDFADIVVIFFSLIISMTLHEAMHAFTGYWLGDDTAYHQGRISLNPFRHIDPFTTIVLPIITLILFRLPLLAAKPVPFNPEKVRYGEYGAALVGISGPITNFLLAAAAAGVINLFQNSLSTGIINVLATFVAVNIALFIFNMVPIPPLDGSRLLYAFAPMSIQEFMVSLERIGILIIFSLVLIFPGFLDMLISIDKSIFYFLIR